jgi:hypothetical protein
MEYSSVHLCIGGHMLCGDHGDMLLHRDSAESRWIDIMEWKVYIGGDRIVLGRLVESFADSDPAIIRDEGGYFLRYSGFGDLGNAKAVAEKAMCILQTHHRRPIK